MTFRTPWLAFTVGVLVGWVSLYLWIAYLSTAAAWK